jgi:hypothetical protein
MAARTSGAFLPCRRQLLRVSTAENDVLSIYAAVTNGNNGETFALDDEGHTSEVHPHDCCTRRHHPNHLDGRQRVDDREARAIRAGRRRRRGAGDLLPGTVLWSVFRNHRRQEVLRVRRAGRRTDRAALCRPRERARHRNDPAHLRGRHHWRLLQHRRRGRI